jgi:hypothetical protein
MNAASIPPVFISLSLANPLTACGDLDSYRSYIQSSKGEWSVAKNGYVRGQAGWFSCRSACYLASGRPVVVQDTGFDRTLPVGEGIVAFSTLEEAVDSIREVESRYSRHAAAARSIAHRAVCRLNNARRRKKFSSRICRVPPIRRRRRRRIRSFACG